MPHKIRRIGELHFLSIHIFPFAQQGKGLHIVGDGLLCMVLNSLPDGGLSAAQERVDVALYTNAAGQGRDLVVPQCLAVFDVFGQQLIIWLYSLSKFQIRLRVFVCRKNQS